MPEIIIPLRLLLAPVLDSVTAPVNENFVGVGTADLGLACQVNVDSKYGKVLNVSVTGKLAPQFASSGLDDDPASLVVAAIRSVSISVWYRSRVTAPATPHDKATAETWIE